MVKLPALVGAVLLLVACDVTPAAHGSAALQGDTETVSAVCARMGRIDVQQKIGDCALPPTESFAESDCRAEMARTDAPDIRAVGAFAACVAAVPACHAGSEPAFQAAVSSCEGLLKDLRSVAQR